MKFIKFVKNVAKPNFLLGIEGLDSRSVLEFWILGIGKNLYFQCFWLTGYWKITVNCSMPNTKYPIPNTHAFLPDWALEKLRCIQHSIPNTQYPIPTQYFFAWLALKNYGIPTFNTQHLIPNTQPSKFLADWALKHYGKLYNTTQYPIPNNQYFFAWLGIEKLVLEIETVVFCCIFFRVKNVSETGLLVAPKFLGIGYWVLGIGYW